MYRRLKGFVWLGILAGVSACAGSKAERYIQQEEAIFNLRIERSACFGSCPVYNMDINAREGSKGVLVFEGIRFVPHVGEMLVADLLPVEIDSLKLFLTQGNFFALDSVYDNPGITDLPSTRIEVRWGENMTQKKAVTGRYDTPQGFDDLVNFIERLRKRHL
jgi:hypothetical protein